MLLQFPYLVQLPDLLNTTVAHAHLNADSARRLCLKGHQGLWEGSMLRMRTGNHGVDSLGFRDPI